MFVSMQKLNALKTQLESGENVNKTALWTQVKSNNLLS